jgi:hypothetical protein
MNGHEDDDTMRAEHHASDFPSGFTSGKYFDRMKSEPTSTRFIHQDEQQGTPDQHGADEHFIGNS